MQFHIPLGGRLCAIVILMTASVVSGGNILTEKPDYLEPCKVSDSNFSGCFGKIIQVLFGAWKDAVPGLKSVGGIDPLHIKSILVEQPPNSQISMSIGLRDILINGLSGVIPKESSFDTNKWILKCRLFVPKMNVKADYSMKGNILNLALDGKGKSMAVVENSVVDVAVRFKVRQEDGYIFTDVDKLIVDIADIEKGSLHLDNLFNGDAALEDSANAILNDNWQLLYEVGRPGFNKAFGAVMKDRLTKVFAYMPASYFFEDLPVGA